MEIYRKRIIFIGGDMRAVYAAKSLEDRYECTLYGFSALDGVKCEPVGVYDIAVLPIFAGGDSICCPFCDDEKLPSPDMLTELLEEGGLVFAGKCSAALSDLCDANGFGLYDYFGREELQIMNAVPTAEGALEIAIRETKSTIYGADVLILGFGRIGKITARYFSALGANVTVAARKSGDIAWTEVGGFKSVSFTDEAAMRRALSETDIILNTAPAKILTGERALCVKPDALLIELASAECTDGTQSFRVIKANGLPGKTAPVTAGKIIADTIKNILNERSIKNGGA